VAVLPGEFAKSYRHSRPIIEGMKMATPSRTYKRRQFFIKKEFQSQFILRFCVLILGGGILSTALVLYFSMGNLTALFQNSRLVITDTAFFILPAVLYTSFITIVLISLTVILVALFVSHKIAGPIFRLEKDISVIGKGDLAYRIHLRKGDQLRELSADINQMTASLNTKIIRIQSGLERVMLLASEQNAPQRFQEELHQLHERIHQNFTLGIEK
jgi:methyl-accepting chemotaxis protein